MLHTRKCHISLNETSIKIALTQLSNITKVEMCKIKLSDSDEKKYLKLSTI